MKQIFTIVGMKHRGEQAVATVASLQPGDDVTLIREPTNRFDPFAVQVWALGQHVGYVKGDQVRPLALYIDAHGTPPLHGQAGPSFDGKFSISDRWAHVEVEI